MVFARCLTIVTLAIIPLAAASRDRAPGPDLGEPVFAQQAEPPRYESAFMNYRRMPDQDAVSESAWQDANNEVGALGGHAGHLRAPPQEASAAAGRASPRPPAGHDHEGRHGMRHAAEGKQ